jgi:hypothetical protein
VPEQAADVLAHRNILKPYVNAMAPFSLPSRQFGRHSGKEHPEEEWPV